MLREMKITRYNAGQSLVTLSFEGDKINFYLSDPELDLMRASLNVDARKNSIELTDTEKEILSNMCGAFKNAIPLLVLASKFQYGDAVDGLIKKLGHQGKGG